MNTGIAPGNTPAAHPAPSLEILVFRFEDRRFGLPAAHVREVVRSVSVTPLPGAPAVVEGIVDFRGTLVPVFDFRRRFGLPAHANEPADRLVVAWCDDRMVALRVDEVLGLVGVAADDVQAPGGLLPRTRHLAGVAQLADGLVLLHDLPAFLSQAEREELEHALVAPRESSAQADACP